MQEGLCVTASHNPIEWNGLKFIDHDGCFSRKIQAKMKIILR